jgi:hypothetical protein
MGVTSCKKGVVFWEATGLTLRSLKLFNIGKRIIVDGNALAWKIHSTNKTKQLTFPLVVHMMAEKLKSIAFSGGFEIVVVVDGDDRPDCKRDSWNRRQSREINDVNRRFCRMKATYLYGKKERGVASDHEKEKLIKFSAAAKRLETTCANESFEIPANFHILLSEKLMQIGACSCNENGGFVHENVLKAKFQADSVIARLTHEGKYDFIMSEDSDFPALLGSECILLCDVREKKKKNRGRVRKNEGDVTTLKDATSFEVHIAGASNAKMRELRKALEDSCEGQTFQQNIEWIEASHPIFDYKDPTLRATIAVSKGCDMYKAGVKNVGHTVIISIIQEIVEKQGLDPTNEHAILHHFRNAMITKLKNQNNNMMTEAEFDTLIKAFMYEPGVIINPSEDDIPSAEMESSGDESIISHSSYIFGAPVSLPEYLKMFASEDVPIDVNSSSMIRKCPGTHCSRAHTYLAFEGSHKCDECNDVFCETCIFIAKEKNKDKVEFEDTNRNLCLKCFRKVRLGAGEEGITRNGSTCKSRNEMIATLSNEHGYQIDRNESIEILQDLYDAYVSAPGNARQLHLNEVAKVKYPLFPADSLTEFKKSDNTFDSLGSFPFSEGGRFISNEMLVPNNCLASVLKLFASFVEYNHEKAFAELSIPEDKKQIYIKSYGHFPTIFIEFAYSSRVDDGYRLLERAARHICDSKTPSIYTQSAELIRRKDNGELFLMYSIFVSYQKFKYELINFTSFAPR